MGRETQGKELFGWRIEPCIRAGPAMLVIVSNDLFCSHAQTGTERKRTTVYF